MQAVCAGTDGCKWNEIDDHCTDDITYEPLPCHEHYVKEACENEEGVQCQWADWCVLCVVTASATLYPVCGVGVGVGVWDLCDHH